MSLNERYDPSNAFAKILRGELPCTKVYEDDDVLAFMDIYPNSRGHMLVIPKLEAVNMFDIPADALKTLIERTQMIAGAVRKALEPEGVFVAQFNGAEAGQTVFHFHFHIIPRYARQPMARHGDAAQADPKELHELAAKIAAAI